MPLSEPDRVAFVVRGWPAPKGSHIAVMRGGRPVVVPVSSGDLREWEKAIVLQARTPMAGRELFDGPLRVFLLFSLHKPKSTTAIYPAQKGRNDIDKFERSTLDALTSVVIADDGYIVDLQARKRWALGVDGLPFPGARIVVERIRPEALIGAA